MEIETEAWPEPGPASTPSSGGGRWRLLHVVLSARDADAEKLANGEGRDA
jgi:hypothetical protein